MNSASIAALDRAICGGISVASMIRMRRGNTFNNSQIGFPTKNSRLPYLRFAHFTRKANNKLTGINTGFYRGDGKTLPISCNVRHATNGYKHDKCGTSTMASFAPNSIAGLQFSLRGSPAGDRIHTEEK